MVRSYVVDTEEYREQRLCWIPGRRRFATAGGVVWDEVTVDLMQEVRRGSTAKLGILNHRPIYRGIVSCDRALLHKPVRKSTQFCPPLDVPRSALGLSSDVPKISIILKMVFRSEYSVQCKPCIYLPVLSSWLFTGFRVRSVRGRR